MKISEKRHSELYSAIHDPIMDIRLGDMPGSINDRREWDEKLFQLTLTIHAKIVEALELQRTK